MTTVGNRRGHRNARRFAIKSTAARWLAMISPKVDADEVAVFVEHGVERVELAEHAHDLELLLMQRIADEIALDGERILHEPRGMEGADRLVMGDARAPRPCGRPTSRP